MRPHDEQQLLERVDRISRAQHTLLGHAGTDRSLGDRKGAFADHEQEIDLRASVAFAIAATFGSSPFRIASPS